MTPFEKLTAPFFIFCNNKEKDKENFLPITTLSMNLNSLNKSKIQHIKGKLDKNLTPSLNGTRYYTSGIWQQILLVIYAIAEGVFGDCLFWKNHCKVEEITNRTFKQMTTNLFLARNIYRQHLEYLYGKSTAPDELIYSEAIKTISSWNQWIFPRLNETSENWNEFLEIRELQYLITLEHIVGPTCRLPVEHLLMLGEKEKALSTSEKEQFKNFLTPWINGVNDKIKSFILPRKTHLLEINTFHRALHALIDIYTAQLTQKTPENIEKREAIIKKQRDLLEKHLNVLGCQLMIEGDETQENYRKEIFERRKIKINKEEYELREPLGTLTFDHKDTFHVYPLRKNEKNYVVVIPANPCIIPRLRLYYEHHASTITFIDTYYEDYWGRFKVCPQMSLCLKDYKWTSVDKIEGEDKNTAEKIATLVKNLIGIRKTPCNLQIKKFFFNEENKIISIFPHARAEYNYRSLESFILEAAQGYPFIFKYMMTKSELSKQQEHTFFNQLVFNSYLNNIPIQKEDICKLLKEKIKILDITTEKKLVEESLEMIEKINQHRNRILNAVGNINISNTIALENIQKIYLQEYDQWNYGCLLPEHLVIDVIKKYNEQYNNKEKK